MQLTPPTGVKAPASSVTAAETSGDTPAGSLRVRAAVTGTCTWPVSYASCSNCSVLEGMSPEEQEAFEQAATEYLWRWTGQRFGVCEEVVRPCRGSACDLPPIDTFFGSGPYPTGGGYAAQSARYGPFLWNGEWFNCTSCRPSSSCSCTSMCAVALPGPVVGVTRVMLDGSEVPATDYAVMGDSIVWMNKTSPCPWPTCQDLTLPSTEEGTFEVTYDRGNPVPVGGQMAAGRLACELALASCSDASCALPQRVQSITRQGVSVTVMDLDAVTKGITGIWAVDAWVSSVTKAPIASAVYSVDVPRGRPRY